MASFLDNTGDIILDAVITDYGRQLLAKGDGSFSIVKFAFGDDEIDYSLWQSGSVTSLKDVNIVTTPIMEAFTNNAASLKSKLLTVGIENLLYLPVVKINTSIFDSANFPITSPLFTGWVVPIDDSQNSTTTALLSGSATYNTKGLLINKNLLTLDQGLDSSDLSPDKSLADELPELYEKEYNIFIDNRLGVVTSATNGTPLTPVSVDDDNIATYKVSLGVNTGFVQQINAAAREPAADTTITGYKGTRLTFNIKPTLTIENNNVLDRLGEKLKLASASGPEFRTVRTSVRVVGVTTGYGVEIPVLFAKKVI